MKGLRFKPKSSGSQTRNPTISSLCEKAECGECGGREHGLRGQNKPGEALYVPLANLSGVSVSSST